MQFISNSILKPTTFHATACSNLSRDPIKNAHPRSLSISLVPANCCYKQLHEKLHSVLWPLLFTFFLRNLKMGMCSVAVPLVSSNYLFFGLFQMVSKNCIQKLASNNIYHLIFSRIFPNMFVFSLQYCHPSPCIQLFIFTFELIGFK